MTERLSLVMIVRDEAAHLPDCLSSVRSLVDEIIVVDTGSADETPAVARDFGARLYTLPWQEDFAAARNESLRHATGDWVLVLDADERLDPGSQKEVRTLIRRMDIVGANVLLRSALPPGQPVSELATPYCRLFRNLPDLAFTGIVHEQILPALRPWGRIVDSGVVIQHLGYRDSNPTKLVRNLDLLSRQIADNPRDSVSLLHLGMTYASLCRWRQAIEAFEGALSQARQLGPTLEPLAHWKLADTHLLSENVQAARYHAQQALTLAPAFTLPRLTLVQCHLAEGDHLLAAMHLGALLERTASDQRGPFGVRLRRDQLLRTLGVCRLKLRDFQRARQAFREALSVDESAEGWCLLGNSELCLGQHDRAADAYRRALALDSDHPEARRRLGRLVVRHEAEAQSR